MSKLDFDADHSGIIHDIQYNFYGNRVATSGSDGKINIFDVTNNTFSKLAELSKHEESVWKISWSHPRFGNLIASCGFDKKVFIWKEINNNVWEIIFQYNDHNHSVNSVVFCPHEYGLVLLCGSSDGSISLHEYKEKECFWMSYRKEKAHCNGVTCASWGPSFNPISFTNEDMNHSLAKLRFITGGCDNQVKIWEVEDNFKDFSCKVVYEHKNWVRDVAWLQYLGYNYDLIASCGEDGYVFIYALKNGNWVNVFEKNYNNIPVWTVSWSSCGSYLAVGTADNKVYLYQETIDEKWEMISTMNDEGQIK